MPRIPAPRLKKLRQLLRNGPVDFGPSELEKLATSGPLADPRLIRDMVLALSGSPYWNFVFERMAPEYGPDLSSALRSAHDPYGRLESGRRLAAIVIIERENARDLIDAAFAGGTRWMIEGALRGMAAAGYAPRELEEAVLRAARHTSEGVRSAAIETLGWYSSDAALGRLIHALERFDGGASGISNAAHREPMQGILRAFERTAHAQTATRLVEKLKTKPPERLARLIFRILEKRPDPRAIALAVERL